MKNEETELATIATTVATSKQQQTDPSSATMKSKIPPPMKHKTFNKSTEPSPNMNVEHSFLTDVADVRQMEQGLLQLLDDFHQGKLQAFGENRTQKKMDEVREQQERLARLHFELDSSQNPDESVNREAANQNMSRLMENLEELCLSIQNLQNNESTDPTPANKTKSKTASNT